MGSEPLRVRRAIRRGLVSLSAAAVGIGAFGVGSAGAATGRPGASTHVVNHSGTYNGQINQSVPKAFTGHIHFVVRRGKITGLRFTTGTLCGVMWAIDKDHSLPTFPLKIRRTGAFAYRGTVAGRTIRLRGRFQGNKAHGTFFQDFSLNSLTCTMLQAAPFTATR